MTRQQVYVSDIRRYVGKLVGTFLIRVVFHSSATDKFSRTCRQCVLMELPNYKHIF